MNKQAIFTVLLIILFLQYACDKDKLLPQGLDTTRYPFSGVGLVRDNPNDTIEIWYANATDEKGINQVLHKIITRDTVVGLNESWITYEYGIENRFPYRKFIPDYSKGGGHYFRICNKGKENIFYFIVPHPNIPKLAEQDYNLQLRIQYKNQFIYDMIFKNGEYAIKNLSEISDLYKKHDKDNNTLSLYLTNINGNPPGKFSLDRSSTFYYGDLDKTTKINGKAFFYGTIYSGECMQASKNMGIMLEGVQISSY